MEKAVNITLIALAAAAGFQIAAMNFMVRGASCAGLFKGADFSTLQAAFDLMPFLF